MKVATPRFLATLVAALLLLVSHAWAQDYPTRSIRLIVPYAAGGPSDIAARLFAEAFARQIGQSLIVENRTGAGGVIGTEMAYRAPPDGYTLLVSAAATFNVVPAVKKAAYEPEKDFVALGQVWYAQQALVVRGNSPIKTMADLVAHAKANPGKMTFGSAGNGTTTHLSIGMLSRIAGVDLTHVAYRGTSESVVAVMGGHIDAIFGDISTVTPHIRSGALTALAVTGAQRSPLLPEVPTTAEAGFPGVLSVNWYGIHVHAKTPPAVVEKLKSAVRAVQLDPVYKAALAKQNNMTYTVGAEAFADMIHKESQRLFPLVRELGIKF